MKYYLSLTVSLAVLLLIGCSSTPTHVDKGTIHATSFSFIARNPGSVQSSPEGREKIHAIIQDSISRNLISRGLSRQATGGDVVVAYLVVVGNNASTEAITTYFGAGRDPSGLEDKAQNAYDRSKNPNYFEAGTLLVDIIDGKTYKLLKRSHVTRPLLRDVTMEVRVERIQEAVDAVLKDVRIQRP